MPAKSIPSSKQVTSSSTQNNINTIDVYKINKYRTIDIFCLAERDETCYVAIEKLKKSGKIDLENIIKPISYEDVITSVENLNNNDALYSQLITDALPYINNNQELPPLLLAKLIKIQIALTINKDVILSQNKVEENKILDNKCAALVDKTEPAGKKKKGKNKNKAKSKSSSKKKNKKNEKVYDVCDPNNVVEFKSQSRIVMTDRIDLIINNTIEIEHKHLYIVLVDIYNVEVIEELFNIGINIIGIIEITKSLSQNNVCICVECPEQSESEYQDEMSDKSDISWKPFEVEQLPKGPVKMFWHKIYEYLESDDYCPEYLDQTFHMSICLSSSQFEKDTVNDEQCLNLLSNVGTEIIKFSSIKRDYVNYIRNLKIYPVESTPSQVSSDHFKVYNNVINKIPPECVNVFVIVYAIIEEVCKQVPDPPQMASKASLSHISENSNVTKSSDDKSIPINFHGIKTQIANILYNNINMHSQTTRDNIKNNKEFIYSSKASSNITSKIFLANENSDLEIMINSYGKIISSLLDINTEKLVLSYPILLWKRFPFNETIQQKIYNSAFELNKSAEHLKLPLQELKYIIQLIFFNFLHCQEQTNNNNIVYDLQLLFPKTNNIRVPVVFQCDIPFKFNIKAVDKEESHNDIPIPYVQLLDQPNLYEAKNVIAHKWYESLPSICALQELYKAEKNYICLDYRYCSFDDTILLRYHNAVDEFGINVKYWNNYLRTPICTIREFCKYIIHNESEWLKSEEEADAIKFNKKYEDVLQEGWQRRKVFYPDLVFKNDDFIQRGSFKWKAMQEADEKQKPDKKGKKATSGKATSRKATSGKATSGKATSRSKSKEKGKKGKAQVPSQLPVLEKLIKPIITPEPSKLSLHCANDNAPFSFYAYDISNYHVQLTGTTTVFHSQDNYKVTIDQTRFIKAPKSISINVSMNDNCLILHYNDITKKEPFAFHFWFSDNSVVTLEKQTEPPSLEEKLVQNIDEALKKSENLEKRQNLYFVSKTKSSVLRCFNVPYITKRNLILSEDLIQPFINQIKGKGITIKLKFADSLDSSETNIIENVCSSSNTQSINKIHISNSKLSNTSKSKLKKIDENVSDLNIKNIKRALSESSVALLPLERSNKKVLRKIKKATELQLPMFKICSSRLHKYQYVKRTKSRLEMPVGCFLKRLLYKPHQIKSNVDLEVCKLLPVAPFTDDKAFNQSNYKIKICLPSGLVIESMDGIKDFPFHFRQRYLDKGPQCKILTHEHSRTFLRNGNIIIKNIDGNIDIFSIAGQKVSCQIPNFRVKSKSPLSRVSKPSNLSSNNLIPLRTTSLTKFQKQLSKLILRLNKHLINGNESQYLRTYRECQKWKKIYIKDPSQTYILQKNIENFKQFNLITSNGNKLKVSPTIITETKKYYTSRTIDYRYQEIYYTREDGAHGILNQESLLVTQFPDGTRLSTWIDVEQDSLYMEEIEIVTNEKTKDEYQQVNDSDFADSTESPSVSSKSKSERSSLKEAEIEEESEQNKEFYIDDNGWVSVHLNIKFEHPNYATITYYGIDKRTEIILPNNAVIIASSNGDYTIKMSKDSNLKVTTEEILLESKLCNTCSQKDIITLNIKPWYYKLNVNPHEAELLRAIDSFKKIFVVNYAGQCFRNTDYINKRLNAVNCQNHINSQNQKLFILNRSLAGCKLWDVESYKNCLLQANELEMPVQQHRFYKEIQKVYRKPFHERYIIPYDEPNLVLTKNKPKTNPPKEITYITTLQIKELPTLQKLYQVFLILSKSLQLNTSDPVLCHSYDEFQLFVDYAIDEILGKHGKLEKKIITKPIPKRTIPPFSVRHKKWSNECNEYWREIRNNIIPKYFASTCISLTKPEDSHEVSAPEVLEEPQDSGNFNCSSFIQEINIDNTSSENINTNDLNAASEPIQEEIETKNQTVEKLQTPIPLESPLKDKNKAVETLWITTDIGKTLLKEVANKIKLFAVNMPSNQSEDVSINKVNAAIESLLHNLKIAVENYELEIFKNDIVDSIINRILEIELNPIELILLLDIVGEEKLENKAIKDYCGPLISMKTAKNPKSLFTTTNDGYFGVYDHYKTITNTLKQKQSDISIKHGIKTVYKNQNVSDRNICEVGIENNKVSNIISDPEEKIVTHTQHYQKCSQCIAKSQSMSSYQQNNPSLVKNDDKSVQDLPTEKNECGASVRIFSSTFTPILELSSETSLLSHTCEDLKSIDKNTVVLHKDDYKDESKTVLFGVRSLKWKGLGISEPGPYIYRNPEEETATMTNVIAKLKNMPEQVLKKLPKSIRQSETSLQNPMIDDNLNICRECILRTQETMMETDSISHFKSKSDILSSLDKEIMATCDIDIIDDLFPKPHVVRHTVAKATSVICDKDAKVIKGYPAEKDQLILTPTKELKKEITQKSVGSQTQKNVDDKCIQSFSN